ncbi:AraC family transcriptional regulator [Cohnella silvisoli]|uniref:AraC family transcriptional regulator n=1 Tax=Cohnella silvisoli TaxID=2873699 RepID=A0ABV1L2R2_9BACL|nr:AraC family transcriptional regulator [Cohnella silvisoli]MCD9025863.1 AraC family transcriptional regulator [Cohnella silvisoli]
MKDYGQEIAEFLYYTPGQLDKEGAFWPIRAGTTRAKPGYCAGPKKIESYSIHFVREGKVLLEYGDKRITLVSGDMFCLFPMRTYTYRAIDGMQEPQMSWLVIDGPGAERMLRLAGFRQETPFVVGGWTRTVQRTLDRIMNLMRKDAHPPISLPLEMQSHLYKLFAMLANEMTDAQEKESTDWLKRSMDYMDLHAAEGISVQQASEVAGVNRTYFSAVFTEKTGMTPIMYITKVRMDKAKRLLENTRTSITEIAYTLGYSSLYTFTRTFKNRFSLTPTDYRRLRNVEPVVQ